jgi:hypothetical protein
LEDGNIRIKPICEYFPSINESINESKTNGGGSEIQSEYDAFMLANLMRSLFAENGGDYATAQECLKRVQNVYTRALNVRSRTERATKQQQYQETISEEAHHYNDQRLQSGRGREPPHADEAYVSDEDDCDNDEDHQPQRRQSLQDDDAYESDDEGRDDHGLPVVYWKLMRSDKSEFRTGRTTIRADSSGRRRSSRERDEQEILLMPEDETTLGGVDDSRRSGDPLYEDLYHTLIDRHVSAFFKDRQKVEEADWAISELERSIRERSRQESLNRSTKSVREEGYRSRKHQSQKGRGDRRTPSGGMGSGRGKIRKFKLQRSRGR